MTVATVPMAGGDENANSNVPVLVDAVKQAEEKLVVKKEALKEEASNEQGSARVEDVLAPTLAGVLAKPSEQQKAEATKDERKPLQDSKKLEPSMTAMMASRYRGRLIGGPRNIASSERTGLSSPFVRRDEVELSTGSTGMHSVSAESAASTIAPVAASQKWEEALRGATKADKWTGELTVPRAPTLRTQSRSRSHSRSVDGRSDSVVSTPQRSRQATPQRRLRETPLNSREQAAVEHYLERKLAARRPSASPARRTTSSRLETPSPARSNMGSRGNLHSAGSYTPQRAGAVTPLRTKQPASATSSPRGTHGSFSVESRLSKLAQPTPPCRHPGSEELEARELEKKRQDLKEQMRQNERTCREAISNPEAIHGRSRNYTPVELTVPCAPLLRTASRGAARSRSASRDRVSQRSVTSGDILIPREQQAIEQHLQRIGGEHHAVVHAEPVVTQGPPAGCDSDAWVKDAPTVQECAERARIVAMARQAEETKAVKEKLFIFGANAGAKRSVAKAKPRACKPAVAVAVTEEDGQPRGVPVALSFASEVRSASDGVDVTPAELEEGSEQQLILLLSSRIQQLADSGSEQIAQHTLVVPNECEVQQGEHTLALPKEEEKEKEEEEECEAQGEAAELLDRLRKARNNGDHATKEHDAQAVQSTPKRAASKQASGHQGGGGGYGFGSGNARPCMK